MDTVVLIKSYHSPFSLPTKILFVNSKSNSCLPNFLFLYADFSKSLNFFSFFNTYPRRLSCPKRNEGDFRVGAEAEGGCAAEADVDVEGLAVTVVAAGCLFECDGCRSPAENLDLCVVGVT